MLYVSDIAFALATKIILLIFSCLSGEIAQLVEQRTENHKYVVDSTAPGPDKR